MSFAVGPRLCPHVALHSRCALRVVQCVWVSDTTATLHQQIGATCLQCVRGCKLHHCLAFANRCYELWSGSVFCVPYAARPSQLEDTTVLQTVQDADRKHKGRKRGKKSDFFKFSRVMFPLQKLLLATSTSLASLSRFPNHCSIAPANRS